MLPLEQDFSFGMRRYLVLINEERGSFPVFDRGVRRYVLKAASEEEGGQPAVQRFTHLVSRVEKGKQPEDDDLAGQQGGDVRQGI